MDAKKAAAERAVELIEDGMTVGLGTGSTVNWAIQKIGQEVKEGLNIKAIATSKQSEGLARHLQIPLTSFAKSQRIDLTIDGADEVDKHLNLIKGGGGALLREKIVAAASLQYIIIVDENKLVDKLGKFALPIEVVKFGLESTYLKLEQLGCQPRLRMMDNGLKTTENREGMEDERAFVTDNGNYILDCDFGRISETEQLERQINLIPGVVDNGLFIGMADKVIIGREDGTVKSLDRASL